VDDVLTEKVIWQVDAWDARAAKVGSLWQFWSTPGTFGGSGSSSVGGNKSVAGRQSSLRPAR
jgi:hypothetical protein